MVRSPGLGTRRAGARGSGPGRGDGGRRQAGERPGKGPSAAAEGAAGGRAAYLQPGGDSEWKVERANICARSAIFPGSGRGGAGRAGRGVPSVLAPSPRDTPCDTPPATHLDRPPAGHRGSRSRRRRGRGRGEDPGGAGEGPGRGQGRGQRAGGWRRGGRSKGGLWSGREARVREGAGAWLVFGEQERSGLAEMGDRVRVQNGLRAGTAAGRPTTRTLRGAGRRKAAVWVRRNWELGFGGRGSWGTAAPAPAPTSQGARTEELGSRVWREAMWPLWACLSRASGAVRLWVLTGAAGAVRPWVLTGEEQAPLLRMPASAGRGVDHNQDGARG